MPRPMPDPPPITSTCLPLKVIVCSAEDKSIG
jgi:hypothetical protein